MPTHDIIDNREEKLADRIRTMLSSTEMARFAVGYFFVSGLETLGDSLASVKELRLLIGNTTNRETLEQVAEGYRRLELVAEAAEAEAFPKRSETRQMIAGTAGNIRSSLELMDQTDGAQRTVCTLARLIEDKRLKVRVYTKGRLHAKAYIFDYRDDGRYERGIAVVGSSNLTLAGVSHNTELNVVVHGNDNHAGLVKWFEALWAESQEFDAALLTEIQQSWVATLARPYDVYMKTLYTLVRDRLEGEDEREVLWDDDITKRLADFQRVAVKQAVQMIRDWGGAFVADVVGLGKSYIGAAIVKHFERTENARPLIVCPATLVEMWDRYNEVYQLNARVLSMGLLRDAAEGARHFLLEDVRFRDRNFVLIDESHNFRSPHTQRYEIMQAFLAAGKRCCLLTATPRNKSALDVYHQLKLFHPEETTDLPISPPNLKDYFKLIEKGERQLQAVLSNVMVRRRRRDIIRFYGYDAETNERIEPSRAAEYLDGKRRAYVMVGGRHQFFPRRQLETVTYSIEDTYQGLYQTLRGHIGKARKGQPLEPVEGELTYARYGLWHYVRRGKQRQEPYATLHRAGSNLRGLIRVLLFKRFESSVYAFHQSIHKLLLVHERFREALLGGIVPAGDDAQAILYEPNEAEERDILDALRDLTGRYDIADFDVDRLLAHVEHDIQLFRRIDKLVEPITPKMDAKLQTFIKGMGAGHLKDRKVLIFTQYADTARYLYENLNPGDRRADIDVIFSGDKSKARVVGRFAPKANPEYRGPAGEVELMKLVATDVLAEGLNLQDCDTLINYDLHWNPVRLIQRFGRIDRIGTEHSTIYGVNFLPEAGIERNLGLRTVLRNRIQDIHDTIGEDAAILDEGEQLNESAMYAIYENKGAELADLEDAEDGFVDLNEAEELLRQLRREDPAELGRIADLRDGIRSSRPSRKVGAYVFCEASYPERPDLRGMQQLVLVDEEGQPVSRDVPEVLRTIRCGRELAPLSLPDGYNSVVMRAKRAFEEEVKHRQAERDHTLSLTVGQRYVLRELRTFFGTTQDEDQRAQINLLEQAFRGAVTQAVRRELNFLRRNGVIGDHLVKCLADLYHQHGLGDRVERARTGTSRPIVRVVCSEALVEESPVESDGGVDAGSLPPGAGPRD